jgi:hypothetical protein
MQVSQELDLLFVLQILLQQLLHPPPEESLQQRRQGIGGDIPEVCDCFQPTSLLNRKKNAARNIAADLQCYPKRGNYNPTNLEQSK